MSKALLCFECEEPALPAEIFCREHLHMQPDRKEPKYTQGVCQDGAAILNDGQLMTIEEILSALNAKPTHYAVIDEHGEIAHAVRIKSFTDAKQDCERYKGLMCNITPQAKDWAVKGVTVHE